MRTRESRLATMCEIKVNLLSRFLFFFKVRNEYCEAFFFFLNNTAEKNDERMRRERAADPGEDPRTAEAGAHVLLLQREPYQTYLRWLFGA